MRTIKQMSMVEARKLLTSLPGVMGSDGTIEVTRRGKPVMVLIPYELYEALVETIDIMGDPEMMNMLKAGIRDLKNKKMISWEEAVKQIEL
ncbi:MAG: type II toxin-antitoxin system Phd/YefM family antitoxin [Candidatus Coatesbacteria bacterium]|nr:type II toxin-antitoxin system Phd/YefM family antitoxin [Candidatus Coatesbacteria bacterium]